MFAIYFSGYRYFGSWVLFWTDKPVVWTVNDKSGRFSRLISKILKKVTFRYWFSYQKLRLIEARLFDFYYIRFCNVYTTFKTVFVLNFVFFYLESWAFLSICQLWLSQIIWRKILGILPIKFFLYLVLQNDCNSPLVFIHWIVFIIWIR